MCYSLSKKCLTVIRAPDVHLVLRSKFPSRPATAAPFEVAGTPQEACGFACAAPHPPAAQVAPAPRRAPHSPPVRPPAATPPPRLFPAPPPRFRQSPLLRFSPLPPHHTSF